MKSHLTEDTNTKKFGSERKSPSPFPTPVELDLIMAGEDVNAERPIVTTPLSLRKALPIRSKNAKHHIQLAPQDITDFPDEWATVEAGTEPTITEPAGDLDYLNMIRHHSSPDFHDVLELQATQLKGTLAVP